MKGLRSASRVYISSPLVRRFAAHKVNTLQFVGNSAFPLLLISTLLCALSLFVSDVHCVVRGDGPRPQKRLVYSYPVVGNLGFLTDVESLW